MKTNTERIEELEKKVRTLEDTKAVANPYAGETAKEDIETAKP